jgi:predicted dehydrogenase
MMRILIVLLMLVGSAAAQERLRVGILGLAHGHAGGFFARNLSRADLDVVGISEKDAAVAGRYVERYKLDRARVFGSHAEMLDKAKPDVVMVFTDTFDHLEAVELCARRKLHVMMEKPLAVSNEHARKMAAVAKAAGIQVMVNYETTWYPVNTPIWRMVREEKSLGPIRRIVTHYGHQGPKEIGVQPEFLAWLTDPVRNGAGTLFDFGCYGANFASWLFDNERPVSVYALAKSTKPSVYAKVEDDATIVIQYKSAQVIVEPSWSWPYSRKDMAIYGETGLLVTSTPKDYRFRVGKMKAEEAVAAPGLAAPEDDVIRYLAAVVRGKLKPSGLTGLENNLLVTEILVAARESARTGRVVRF